MEMFTIISNAKLNRLLEEDEARKRKINWLGNREFEGLLYSTWEDKTSGSRYAVRETRSVNMGFNSNEPGKEEEFLEIMKREGCCRASWGVTGRTIHKILAQQLAKKYPQFRFEIGDNYECAAYDDHRLVLIPGFEPEVAM